MAVLVKLWRGCSPANLLYVFLPSTRFPCLPRRELRKVGIERSQGDESYRGGACCSMSLLKDFKGLTCRKEPFTILHPVPCFTKHTNFILMTFQVLKQGSFS